MNYKSDKKTFNNPMNANDEKMKILKNSYGGNGFWKRVFEYSKKLRNKYGYATLIEKEYIYNNINYTGKGSIYRKSLYYYITGIIVGFIFFVLSLFAFYLISFSDLPEGKMFYYVLDACFMLFSFYTMVHYILLIMKIDIFKKQKILLIMFYGMVIIIAVCFIILIR